MKKFSLIIFFVVVIMVVNTSLLFAMSSSPDYQIQEHQSIERLQIINGFSVPQLNTEKKIWVYLPPNYKKSDKRYPVLYLNEGQNLFGLTDKTEQLNELLNELYTTKKSKQVIIIGIESDNPQQEFVAWDYYNQGKYINNPVGNDYLDFIAVSLKPYIDLNYRTLADRKNTAIAGVDFGGLFSLYAHTEYPHVFSKIAAFSPALWVYEYGYNDFKVSKRNDFKIYLDARRKETTNFTWNKVIVHKLQKHYHFLLNQGYKKEEIKLVINDTREKNKKRWLQRFLKAYLWLFEKD